MNLVQNHFTDWDHTITIHTSTPIPAHVDQHHGEIQIEDSNKNEDDDEETADRADPIATQSCSHIAPCASRTHVPTPSSTSGTGPSVFVPSYHAPTVIYPEATTTSVPPTPPSASRLTSILPIFFITPSRKVSLRVLVPLLQKSLLSVVNHNIHSHNGTRDVILIALGHGPPILTPLFTSPYHTASSSRSRSHRVHSILLSFMPPLTLLPLRRLLRLWHQLSFICSRSSGQIHI